MRDLDDVAARRLSALLAGALVTHMISAAAALGLPDALAGGAEASETLAGRCGADPDGVRRLLRGLASVGVTEELAGDTFRLTGMGHLLRAGHPRSLRSWAVVQGQLMAPMWSGLLPAVRSGRTAASVVFGRPFYDHLAARPDLDDHWNAAMAETAAAWLDDARLLGAVDWPAVRLVADVGGGRGALLAALLRRHPHLRGVLYDAARVVAGAARIFSAAGVAGRARAVAGDFFAWVPPGADVYLLARVVFNWDDDQAAALLGACRRAMGRQAVLLVIDQVIPGEAGPHPAKVNDVSLLAMGGRARDLRQWEALAGRAGLRLAGPPAVPSAGGPWAALLLRAG